MAAHDDVLAKLGFEPDAELASFVQGYADDPNTDDGSLSHNGEFKVLGAWKKGDVWLHLERNTAPEPGDDDMETVVTHPPVLVVCKGDKRICVVRQRDPEALEAVLSDLE